jgi:hypothetical protein
MTIYIEDVYIWLQGVDDPMQLLLWAHQKRSLPNQWIPPIPSYYPKNQLRRLSPFSRVILYALSNAQALTKNYPLVFASQHGDLEKTVALIKQSALGEDLSPTQFALSVHNATTGLFSIATHNTAPTTTISAGKNTFIEGCIEASMQCQQEEQSVIYTYCDFDIPKEYDSFSKRTPARCIRIVFSHKKNKHSLAKLHLTLKEDNVKEKKEILLPELHFIRYFCLQSQKPIKTGAYHFSLDFITCD